MTICRDVIGDKIRMIHALAENSFCDHTIESVFIAGNGLHRSWVCSNKGSCIYRFRVTTWPGWIAVTGDIGTMMWSREVDMVPWVRGAINSIDYFEEKVPNGIATKEWDPDIARAWIAERRIESCDCDEPPKDYLEKLDDVEYYIGEGEERFGQELHESLIIDGEDWPGFDNFNGRFLWCREALLWWLAALTNETE